MVEIAILYDLHDRANAEGLANGLIAEGYSVWWDVESLDIADYHKVLDARMKNVDCVITLWSAQSTTSEWIKAESNFARRHNRLISVRLDEADLPPAFVQDSITKLPFWKTALKEKEIGSVVAAIKALPPPIAVSSPPPPITRGRKWGKRISVYLLTASLFGLGLILTMIVPVIVVAVLYIA